MNLLGDFMSKDEMPRLMKSLPKKIFLYYIMMYLSPIIFGTGIVDCAG